MFHSNALYPVDSLQVLCQKVLTVSKANDRDLRFLQGIIKEESCTNKECRCSQPANNCNLHTSHQQESRWSRHNFNFHVQSLTVNRTCRTEVHSMIVFTNDQQLYCITQQVTWWKPEEWKYFAPILCGMHILIHWVRWFTHW